MVVSSFKVNESNVDVEWINYWLSSFGAFWCSDDIGPFFLFLSSTSTCLLVSQNYTIFSIFLSRQSQTFALFYHLISIWPSRFWDLSVKDFFEREFHQTENLTDCQKTRAQFKFIRLRRMTSWNFDTFLPSSTRPNILIIKSMTLWKSHRDDFYYSERLRGADIW